MQADPFLDRVNVALEKHSLKAVRPIIFVATHDGRAYVAALIHRGPERECCMGILFMDEEAARFTDEQFADWVDAKTSMANAQLDKFAANIK